jgi:hypothetical protein
MPNIINESRYHNMDEDVMRRLVKGILALMLTTLATWLAGYLTDKLLGPPEQLEEA